MRFGDQADHLAARVDDPDEIALDDEKEEEDDDEACATKRARIAAT